MRKFYSVLAIFATVVLAFAQKPIYSEDMGKPTKSPIDISENTFQNGSPIQYSGTADVRDNLVSGTYEGASGYGNVLFNSRTDQFIISGINTKNFKDITMSFGHTKTTNASSNELIVAVSADGTNWTELAYSRATGAGTNGWILIKPTGTIPSTENLRIKFDAANLPTAGQFRIDDVILKGEEDLSVNDSQKVRKVLVKNTIFTNNLQFNVKSDIQIVNLEGKVVRTLKVQENTTFDLSSLQSGVYFVTGVVDGVKTTQKVIKK